MRSADEHTKKSTVDVMKTNEPYLPLQYVAMSSKAKPNVHFDVKLSITVLV